MNSILLMLIQKGKCPLISNFAKRNYLGLKDYQLKLSLFLIFLIYFWYKRYNPLDYNHGWIDITEVLIHPKSNSDQLQPKYNVAIMKLKDSIGQHEFFGHPQSDIIRPICLPESGLVDSLVGATVYTTKFLEKYPSTIISSDDCTNRLQSLNHHLKR